MRTNKKKINQTENPNALLVFVCRKKNNTEIIQIDCEHWQKKQKAYV